MSPACPKCGQVMGQVKFSGSEEIHYRCRNLVCGVEPIKCASPGCQEMARASAAGNGFEVIFKCSKGHSTLGYRKWTPRNAW